MKILTLREARKLLKPMGRIEPYRGYSSSLPDGRVISHSPAGVISLHDSMEALQKALK